MFELINLFGISDKLFDWSDPFDPFDPFDPVIKGVAPDDLDETLTQRRNVLIKAAGFCHYVSGNILNEYNGQ
jgi:hypothetical protein